MRIRDEDQDEAERLKMLPKKEQRQIIEMYRDVAAGKGVPAHERKAGLDRAAALENLLKLAKEKRKEQ